jgi:hypothetical protein
MLTYIGITTASVSTLDDCCLVISPIEIQLFKANKSVAQEKFFPNFLHILIMRTAQMG